MSDQLLDGYTIYTHQPAAFREGRAEFWYGDLVLDTDPVSPKYIMPDMLSGSDYSGSAVERANFQTFLAEFGDLPGVHRVFGGHGTYAVAVAAKTYQVARRAPAASHHALVARLAEMYEALVALEEYPVLDDEALYDIEREWQDEAWGSTICGDYLSALASRIADLAGEHDVDADIEWLAVDDGEVRRTFETTAADAGVYWESEHSSAWIDAEAVAQATPLNAVTGWIDWVYTDAD